MKSMSFFTLIVFLMVLFSSCAGPQPVQMVKPVTPPPKAVAPKTVAEQRATDAEHIKNVVTTRQGALQSIYRKQSAINPMEGGLLFTLHISEMGMVQEADIAKEEGTLSQDFISAMRAEVLTWRFLVREKMNYSFKAEFRKQ
ncbi:MAG: hypothetical protein RBS43_05065 [Candidatus Cloacimonas sp.]|jgi:PBP1b-binding outer membrane lipoprotein LpoB|nr:hypothetical protein [Candidatus Cloacimonas sp.]